MVTVRTYPLQRTRSGRADSALYSEPVRFPAYLLSKAGAVIRPAVVELSECRAPRFSTETMDPAPVPIHGGKIELFARREILSVRSDVIRNNWFYRGYETSRWVAGVIRTHWRESAGPRSFLSSFRHSTLKTASVQTEVIAE